MFNTRRDLSVRAERSTLDPADEAGWKQLLYTEGDTDGWRIVEASSRNGRPFDMELSWSAANGSGAKALVTVAHAARVWVFARTVQVRMKNLSRIGNAVGVTIADGYAETRNQFEVRSPPELEAAPGPVAIRVPAFAKTAWVECADPDADGLIVTLDGEGRRRGATNLSSQPDGGIPVGGAGELQFWLGPVPFRVVFRLSI